MMSMLRGRPSMAQQTGLFREPSAWLRLPRLSYTGLTPSVVRFSPCAEGGAEAHRAWAVLKESETTRVMKPGMRGRKTLTHALREFHSARNCCSAGCLYRSNTRVGVSTSHNQNVESCKSDGKVESSFRNYTENWNMLNE